MSSGISVDRDRIVDSQVVPSTVVYAGTHDIPTSERGTRSCPIASGANLWRDVNRAAGTVVGAAFALLTLAWSFAAALAIASAGRANLGKEPTEGATP